MRFDNQNFILKFNMLECKCKSILTESQNCIEIFNTIKG